MAKKKRYSESDGIRDVFYYRSKSKIDINQPKWKDVLTSLIKKGTERRKKNIRLQTERRRREINYTERKVSVYLECRPKTAT